GDSVSDFAIIVFVPVLDEQCVAGGDCFYDEAPALDAQAPVLGYFSFSLHVDRWSSIFAANVKVAEAASGNEHFLNLDIFFYHDKKHREADLYLLVGLMILSVVVFVLCLCLRQHLERGFARERQSADEQRRAATAAGQRVEELIRYRFETSKKTERYLNHELKNRIFVLGQSCAEQPHVQEQIEELTEVLNNKAVLMRLSTGRYEPFWDAVELTALIDKRWQRFVAANNPFVRAGPTGAAAYRTTLRLDKALFNIIQDNMLSNAFKYGDAARPPSLALNVEPVDDTAARVRVSLELRNWAGPEHAALLRLGEEKLNEIALTDGQRAHEHAAELSSGDGFPMAAAAASALGGTVRLVLLSDGVVAKLELPDIATVLPGSARFAAVPAASVELSRLKVAMVDDSATFRKTFTRLAEKVTSQEPVVAGETRESIDNFSKAVVDSDCDIVFLDFNFAPVHHTKTGADICRECRELDAEEGNVPRLIFIVSANDSPEDAERYRAAGADGTLGKKLTAAKLRQVLDDAAPRRVRDRASTPLSELDAITVEVVSEEARQSSE
ncbi:hypothetical protein M885DRAFT_560906, partial [Pelagophyceae sp. CCMP2097]